MKAMILAAGRGQRLQPLTDETPKPLIEVGSHRLIEHHLIALNHAGINDIIINISYLARKIVDVIGDGSRYGVNITYSWEPTEALETGGGIRQALPLLGNEPFLAVSADIWTDFPFDQLPRQLSALAHLILVPNPPHHPKGDFCLIDQQVNMEGNERYNFGGIGIYHPKLFSDHAPGRFPLAPLLEKAIRANQVSGELYNGHWINITTTKELAIARSACHEIIRSY